MVDESNMTVEEMPYGLKVSVKSKRGTDPRDQDTVESIAYFDDMDELDPDTRENLNLKHNDTMRRARNNDPNNDRE